MTNETNPTENITPNESTPPKVKQLRRSRANRVIGGVLGGWAEYLRIDPTVVRVVFVASTFIFCGVTIPIYIAAWILTSEEAKSPATS